MDRQSVARLQTCTDEELVRRFRADRDRESAFLELFERYCATTYGFLRRRVGDPERAAEMNQELFVAVLGGLDRFRGESTFKTWLFRLAHNHLSNLRRRLRTHADERWDAMPAAVVADVVPAEGESAEASVLREERSRHLVHCLARLPEIERAVVLGQYYEGATLEELTQRLQMTNPSGARAALIAAQRKLRRCLEAAAAPREGDPEAKRARRS